ncbi:MAG: peptide chain release factor N(5)-glutamine methyltransferase [Proteobacteria bacterium]|nr:peptide chain release factor N(5)-glutamine methyltransferase [Pseudomonadota bacterium]MBI3496504.1 peptide chain release factor N(5)-glutamine methyltransferase [Pseudomonadota bacterium]
MTIGEELSQAVQILAQAGVPQPRLDARVLLAHALGGPLEPLMGAGEVSLPPAVSDQYQRFIARRVGREPVSRIVGHREFWSLNFVLSPATLDPRPDSETLIEAALAVSRPETPLAVLDLGTGSGCLLLALLSERPLATGLGIDIDPEAVAVAGRNAARHGLAGRVRFQEGDWGAGLDGPYDLILCNPPYLPTGEIEQLEPEVARHEPRLALIGGSDGLEQYRRLGAELLRLIGSAGFAVVEVGRGQADEVEAILRASGLRTVERRRDLSAIERCLTLVRAGNSA